MSDAPLKSALKGSKAKAAAAETPVSAEAAAAAAKLAADTARIRAAAEVKATQLQATARAQEKWAEWVTLVQMKLIDAEVSASTMQRAKMVLRPSEYDEVTEERVSARMCAYPTCKQPLPASAAAGVTPKKFHLSLKQQRVYDVSQAHNFCGEVCFLASEEYKQALSDEPFYLRQMRQRSSDQAAPAPSSSTDDLQPPAELAPPVSASDSSVSQLLIVEKSQTVTALPISSKPTSIADAFAVEGYLPQAAAPAISAQIAADPSLAEDLPSSTTFAPAPTPAPRPAVTFSLPESSAASSSSSSSAPDFLDFTPLPSVLASVSPGADGVPLSRAEFAALTPDQQLDYMGYMALQERKNIPASTQQPNVLEQSPPRATGPSVASPAPEAGEQKLRRRKTAAEKEGKATPTKSAAPEPEAALAPAPTSSSATPPVAKPVTTATASSLPKLSSIDLLCDDESDPIVTPEEVRSNLAAVRSATLPPFLAVLQAFMRWTTVHTGNFIRTGKVPSVAPAGSQRQRQSAYLTMLNQHWSYLSQALQLHRPCTRELRELTDTFSFDDAIPPLKPEQWRIVALVLMQAVTHRLALDERAITADHASVRAWDCMQPFSAIASDAPTTLAATVQRAIQQAGFSVEQVDSLYQHWMMQSNQTYQS